MLTYDMNRKDKHFLYERLYEYIKADIVSGRLRDGERLPSKRALSEHLKISKVTVENAYAQLLDEGYIFSKERSGFFVSKPIGAPADRSEKNGISTENREPQKFLADFKTNAIWAEKFPFSVWSKLMRQVISAYGTELLQPMPSNGVLLLRSAIADMLRKFRGMQVNADQIVIGAGTEYLYSLIVQLLGREHGYVVENPGYAKIVNVYHSVGAAVCNVKMDSEGISMEDLSSGNASVVHISPAHHFPSGTVTSQKRRAELYDWLCNNPTRWIIEDDYDCEFRFSGNPIPPIQTICPDRVIYMNTFSKTIAPSVRISYMVLPQRLIESFHRLLGFYSCTVPAFEQYTLAEFLLQGYFEKHINRMRRHYKLLRNLLIERLQSGEMGMRSSISEENAGLHFLLRVNTAYTDAEIVKRCAQKSIRIGCLSEYYRALPAPKSVLVMNYSGIDPHVISEAVLRLEQALFS